MILNPLAMALRRSSRSTSSDCSRRCAPNSCHLEPRWPVTGRVATEKMQIRLWWTRRLRAQSAHSHRRATEKASIQTRFLLSSHVALTAPFQRWPNRAMVNAASKANRVPRAHAENPDSKDRRARSGRKGLLARVAREAKSARAGSMVNLEIKGPKAHGDLRARLANRGYQVPKDFPARQARRAPEASRVRRVRPVSGASRANEAKRDRKAMLGYKVYLVCPVRMESVEMLASVAKLVRLDRLANAER